MSRKTYYITTFGCQMNVLDSERMEGILLEKGMSPAPSQEQADLILVNTCTVREKPERKALSLIGRLCLFKKQKPELILGISGCVAQQYGKILLERFAELDFVLGANQVAKLGEVIDRVEQGERVLEVSFAEPHQADGLFSVSELRPITGVSGFVTIMEGCDNFCSYCVVPYVRGREYSREAGEIISEITALSQKGVKEVVLLGQNVNSYGLKRGSGLDFPELLKMVCRVDGIERVRFTTNHPKDLSLKLIEVMASEEKICEQMHLPLQSGSNRVLERMNRGYTQEEYLGLISKLRSAMPEIGISTDLIVGFPGEREEDFNETLNMVQEIKFNEAFTFRYSARPMTGSAEYEEQVPEEIRLERLWRLEKLVREITEQKNQAEVGKIKEILLEGVSKTNPGRLTGKGRDGRLVHIPKKGAEDLIGELVWVKIKQGLKHSLVGELIEERKKSHWQGEEQCLLR